MLLSKMSHEIQFSQKPLGLEIKLISKEKKHLNSVMAVMAYSVISRWFLFNCSCTSSNSKSAMKENNH